MASDKYMKTYIREVIIRLDFTAPIPKLAKVFPQELQKAILPLFPISEPRQYIGAELMVTKNIQKHKTVQGTDWIFHGLEKEKTLTIAKDNINIAYKNYESYERLKEDFVTVIDALFNIYADLQGRRLGLRYINEVQLVEGKVFEWDRYINTKLLAMLEFPEKPEEINRAFNNLSFNYGEFLLTFQYGIYNPDFPAPVRKKNFILDFDAYRQAPQNLEDIKRSMDEFHGRIQSLFEQSITEKLRNTMAQP